MKLSVLLCMMLAGAASTVDAHMRLITPTPRSPSDSAKGAGPCYGIGKVAGQAPTVYAGGATVNIVIEETINHTGWVRIAFAKSGAAGATPTMEEFDVNVIRMVEDPSGGAAMPDQRTISVVIPNIQCDDCVMQVIQVMTRFGSNYHMCADIRINANAGATPYVIGTCAPNRNYNPVTKLGFLNNQYACGEAYPVPDCSGGCEVCYDKQSKGDKECCWDTTGVPSCKFAGACATKISGVYKCPGYAGAITCANNDFSRAECTRLGQVYNTASPACGRYPCLATECCQAAPVGVIVDTGSTSTTSSGKCDATFNCGVGMVSLVNRACTNAQCTTSDCCAAGSCASFQGSCPSNRVKSSSATVACADIPCQEAECCLTASTTTVTGTTVDPITGRVTKDYVNPTDGQAGNGNDFSAGDGSGASALLPSLAAIGALAAAMLL